MAPEQVFYFVLGFSWLEYLWSSYLSIRQRKIYRTCKTVPSEISSFMDQETFEKARLYALDKSNFGAFESMFSQTLSTLIMWFYGYKYVWDIAGMFPLEKRTIKF